MFFSVPCYNNKMISFKQFSFLIIKLYAILFRYFSYAVWQEARIVFVSSESTFGGEHLLAPCPDGVRRSDVGEPPINIFPHLNYGRGRSVDQRANLWDRYNTLRLRYLPWAISCLCVPFHYCRQFKERLSLIRLIKPVVCQHTHAHSNMLRHSHTSAC